MAALDGRWIAVGTDEHLARILLDRFTRHLPDAADFRWTPAVEHRSAEVSVQLDPSAGVRCSGGGVALFIGDVLGRRQISAPAFRLGSAAVELSHVYMPCAAGRLEVDGRRVPGEPLVGGPQDEPSSTAYLAVAEVWSDPDGVLTRSVTAEPVTSVTSVPSVTPVGAEPAPSATAEPATPATAEPTKRRRRHLRALSGP